MKPIQTAIESLQAKSLCPRLHVDVTHVDTVCPDFVRDKWKQQLVIDLDPSYPLDLSFTKVGVEADMSFGGYVTRCTFPWAAIYVVAERGTGRGQVFASNIPESLRHQFGPPAPQAAVLDPKLTTARDEMKAKQGSRRRKRRGGEAEVEVEAEAEAQAPRQLQGIRAVEDPSDEDPVENDEAAPVDEALEPEVAPEPAPSVEKTAQTRRSAFKVIDGGG